MAAIIDFLNTIFWGYILIYGLLAVGVYFTLRLGFLQIRFFPEMIRTVFQAPQSDRGGISPFQALCTSLASRVGTGNLAGVAVAIALGGPGAIFWMWVVALIGMATSYAESTLAQLYKIRDENGQLRGGPAFYIAKGLKAPWAGAVFSLALILAFGLVFNAVQANSIAGAVEGAFGVNKVVTGVVLTLLAAIVIFGGIKRIARISEIVVPVMALLYLVIAFYVIFSNIHDVPAVFALIFKSAFGIEQAAGGVAGALLNGVKRGLFSNEAGMGSAPNIAAIATPNPHHPSSQGLVQALGVFIDTILICTATALMILLSGALDSGETGIKLTQAAMTEHVGDFGNSFVAIAIFFFAFTSIIGNYSYAENALTFLKLANKPGIFILRVLALAMIPWGAYESVAMVFNAADAAMGLMATINLIAILFLSGLVAKLTRDYFSQRKKGGNPRFDVNNFPEVKDEIDLSVWDEHKK
ncbi:alanine/glycine:cation symporter family protein [Marinomonas mediterranea]|jgi:amino acid carrier protein|uniref:Amino acid carrier protein n=1 Tax=Marinomonas mediterranea (strain ATCC 700492 / JCM 21426 / NBRC 103028 / MMB-1) TaxID=717774 RepID=F2JVC9_MARM1|nr:alanine/glycine:cation symporter family protein [Marinomonas mediterranea]ADZ89387.1 amino acid carrier protein [Marinomonas mediterranea MMB-1]WCN07486.1 amino acid carrier protein [Marinomonas mediterranea]WCN11583.1 amino acid carrier protein [Marinomonas mediterranea]WCN15649.1 amino acid carrier protein [Marinomonas mediterranea MMB-1]